MSSAVARARKLQQRNRTSPSRGGLHRSITERGSILSCVLSVVEIWGASSPDITDQPGVLMSELHEREVDGEEEVAERRARATDGKEAEVVAVAGRWEGLAA